MTPNKAKAEDLLNALQNISSHLERIESKLDEAISLQKKTLREPTGNKIIEAEGKALDVMTLLSIPDHLRKTAMAICKLGIATASEISKETGRARAVESGYLNQLVAMGHLRRGRKGRDVYFQV